MADPPHVMIVEARYYEDVADDLVAGAVAALDRGGATHERVAVPGVFEIPAAVRYSVRARNGGTGFPRVDGYVVLGCVIRGETIHFDIVARESARALQEVVAEYSLALGYGVLAVENREQARVRADPKGGDRGGEAARAALRMIDLKSRFRLVPG